MENTIPQTSDSKTTWFKKFIECLFTGIAIGNTLSMFLDLLPEKWLNKLSDQMWDYFFIGSMAIPALVGLIYSIYWHRNEKRSTIDSPVRHAWFRAILRYWLALEIATYGFAKILKTQFGHSYSRSDTPIGELNGFSLTWHYFSYSYTMAVIIALVQIIGSALLLTRRTTLLGVTVLLPVMLNIMLINVFYDIALGAFINSVIFSLGLIYLLSLQWAPLKQIYLHTVSPLPAIGVSWGKALLRFICIAGAFGFIYYLVSQRPESPLVGKWKVVSLQKNGDTLKPNAWITDSLAWSNVYFEENARVAFCANPYFFDDKRATYSRFTLDTVKKTLTFTTWISDKKRDTSVAKLLSYTPKELSGQGKFGKDSFLVKLQPVQLKKGMK